VNIDQINTGSTVVTNLRHQQELVNTEHDLQRVIKGIDKGITNNLLAIEIRQALHYLGEITGEITSDEIPSRMYGTFCIGM
jgi:tRNA modification GTPase